MLVQHSAYNTAFLLTMGLFANQFGFVQALPSFPDEYRETEYGIASAFATCTDNGPDGFQTDLTEDECRRLATSCGNDLVGNFTVGDNDIWMGNQKSAIGCSFDDVTSCLMYVSPNETFSNGELLESSESIASICKQDSTLTQTRQVPPLAPVPALVPTLTTVPTSALTSQDLHLATNDTTIFRTTSTVIGIAYVFLMIYQRVTQKQFPSRRFEISRITMAIHIACGLVIVYCGCFLRIQNIIKPVLKVDDIMLSYRTALYYTMGTMSCIHTGTILRISPYVMGEKRISIPLYIGAGLVNLHNGVVLLCHPNLRHAFLLWGSVNTFIYQRLMLALLMFGNLDWELVYTYSLIAGASLAYSQSFQPQYIYTMLFLPIVYAPFHEQIAELFDFPLEDTAAGNTPSMKNFTDHQKQLRSTFLKMFSKGSSGEKIGAPLVVHTESNTNNDGGALEIDSNDIQVGNSATKLIDLGKGPEKMNWMKSASVGDAIFVEATSVSHVQEIVKDTVNYPSPIRPAGQILSPTAICSNDGGTTLSTLKLNQIHGIQYVQVPSNHDQAGEMIPCLDVDSGTTLRDAQLYAHKHSLELPFSGEMGMATIGGSSFAVVKDSSIGLPPVKGMGLGDVASMLWSVDVVESNGDLKTYCVMSENEEDDKEEGGRRLFNRRFQGLLDSYGTQGIAVRMLLTLRPKIPTTTTLRVFPFKKDNTLHAQQCAHFLFESWKKASDREGNILGLISNTTKGYVLVEERVPTDKAQHTFAPFGFLLVHFYNWLKRIVIQRGSSISWLYFLHLLSGSFALRFNTPCRRAGNYYDKDIPLEKNKVSFTFASFPMNSFKETVTSTLNFINDYEKNHGFTPQCIGMYVINISGQRIAGPFCGSSGKYRFCFDPIHNNPNDKEWESFLRAFNDFAKERGGRPCLNQTPMLHHDNSYGALAISSDHVSSRFVSPWLQQFLDSKNAV